MSKLPSFQFYPGDWRKDPGVQSLSFQDRGIWFEILLLMFESGERGKLLLNGKPMPEIALMRLLGLDRRTLRRSIANLLGSGVASRDPDRGALISRRMVRDEEIRKIRQAAGKLGGNPRLLKRRRVHSNIRGKDDEEVSSEKVAIPSILNTASFMSAWDEWLSYRKAQSRRKIQLSTMRLQLEKLAEFGEARAIESIRQSIRNGWQGLFEVKTLPGKAGGKSGEFDKAW